MLSNACYAAVALGLAVRPTSPVVWLLIALVAVRALPFIGLILLGVPGMGGP